MIPWKTSTPRLGHQAFGGVIYHGMFVSLEGETRGAPGLCWQHGPALSRLSVGFFQLQCSLMRVQNIQHTLL